MTLMDLHMHSNYSDGKNSIEEMIEACIDLGYQTMAITDHVWKTSDWVHNYAKHLSSLKVKYASKIQIYTGIEAKVLNLEGDIDAHPSFDPIVDFILGSIHRIPNSYGFYSLSKGISDTQESVYSNWFTAFSNLLKNHRVDIVAHPLAELKQFGIRLSSDQKAEIARLLSSSNKLVEINVRHQAPDPELIDQLIQFNANLLVSSDSHSISDLRKYSPEIKKMIDTKNIKLAAIPSFLEKRADRR